MTKMLLVLRSAFIFMFIIFNSKPKKFGRNYMGETGVFLYNVPSATILAYIREAYRAKEREKKRKQRAKKQLPKSLGKVRKDRKKMEIRLRRRLKEKYTTFSSSEQEESEQEESKQEESEQSDGESPQPSSSSPSTPNRLMVSSTLWEKLSPATKKSDSHSNLVRCQEE